MQMTLCSFCDVSSVDGPPMWQSMRLPCCQMREEDPEDAAQYQVTNKAMDVARGHGARSERQALTKFDYHLPLDEQGHAHWRDLRSSQTHDP